MAAPVSAGLLLHRGARVELEVLLVHPGGPYWRTKDAGAWQLPKGGIDPGEDALAAARREFAEEVGPVPPGELRPLGRIRQAGGKYVDAFALAGDFDPATLASNRFEIEWPPRSGKRASFPEIDAARWFLLEDARANILPSQVPLLDRLEALLA